MKVIYEAIIAELEAEVAKTKDAYTGACWGSSASESITYAVWKQAERSLKMARDVYEAMNA